MLGIHEPDKAAIEAGQEPFHRVARVLYGQLRGKRFITGDALTVADFSLGAAMNLWQVAHYPMEPYAEMRRWYETLAALPAWKETLTASTDMIATRLR